MAAFWITVAALVTVLMVIGKLQDLRRRGGRGRQPGTGAGGAAEQRLQRIRLQATSAAGLADSRSASDRRLKEYRRQAIAENDFIVPSGMTHEVRSNGRRRRPHGGR